MKRFLKHAVQLVTPPILLSAAKRLLRPALPASVRIMASSPGHHGAYARWEEAVAAAGGYDAQNILDIQRAAMRKVRDGEAAYERDSVLFDTVTLFHPMLSALLYVASCRKGGLSVLDFGGALGSSYYQNKDLLSHVSPLHWHVVEQPHFVTAGQAEFRNGELDFFPTIETAWAIDVPDVVLLSSVLQYLPDPVKLLQEIVAHGPRFILIDRTPLLDTEPECITVQTVPPSIYRASYACRLMAVPTIMTALSAQYRLRFAFDASVGGPIAVGERQAHHRGYFFERR